MAQSHSLDLEAGSSQYASITDASQTGLDITGNFTVMAWIRIESTSATLGYSQIILGKDVTSTSGYQMCINSSTGKVDWVRHNATTSASTTTSPQVGVWAHIAFTFDGTNIRAYFNGRLEDTQSYTAHSDSTAAFEVGRSPAQTTRYFDGMIKDVKVFSAALSQTQIVTEAHTETSVNANIQGEWNFNNAYTDSSGNGNTLTATNSPVFSTTIPWTAPAAGEDSQFTSGYVSWWGLGEASGTRVDSITATGNDLTDNNTVLSATGKQGDGADFESTNSEYLSITNASQTGLDLTGTGTFAVAFWTKLESLPSSSSPEWMSKQNGVNVAGWAIQLTFTTKVIRWNRHNSADYVNSTTALSAGTWYHIVYTFDGTNLWLYVNGVLENVGAYTIHATSSGDFNMGRDSINIRYIDGIMDEVLITDAHLDYGNILDLYAAGNGIPYTAAASSFTPKISMFM